MFTVPVDPDRQDVLCREATNRQIDVDKKKRQAIEAAKAAELHHERAKLQRWQDGEADGDESDCEAMPEEVCMKALRSAWLNTFRRLRIIPSYSLALT